MTRAAGRALLLSWLLLGCSSTDIAPAPPPELPPEAGAPVLVDSGPPAVTFAAESGFLEVPSQPTAGTYPARLFYSFHPAADDAAHKPLAVLFNGGPGASTSGGLLAYGTGPFALDAKAYADPDAGVVPVANAASWTSFANLLHVDMRMAGFSYGVGAAPDASVFGQIFPIEDASDFVRALLGFFRLHPELRANPVVLVGESYGGVRAQYVLDLVLRYRTEGAAGGSDLPSLLQAHFDAVFPDRAGAAFDEATIATQFGAQVLIQPLVMGDLQWAAQNNLGSTNPYVGTGAPAFADGGLVDPYDVLQPAGWSDRILANAAVALSRAATAAPLLGTELAAVPLLSAAARRPSFHAADVFTSGATDFDPSQAARVREAAASLSALLGPLDADDGYFVALAAVTETYTDDPNVFLRNLRHVRTFITRARYDSAIYAPAIPAAITAVGLTVTADDAPRDGVARPGWFTVALPAGADAASEPAMAVEVRFPTYATSGHLVGATQPGDLHDDVAAWLAK